MPRHLLETWKRTAKLPFQYGPLNAMHFLGAHSRLKADIEARIQDTIATYRLENPGTSFQKYLDIDRWLFVALKRIFQLGLHRSVPKRVLDLGTGAGYFPYACRHFGHDAEALDVPNNPMYNEIIDKLQIKRHTQYIQKFRDIEIDGRFDLVTGFMVCFNNHQKPDLWHEQEWRYFLASVAKYQLLENGQVFLSLNPESKEVPVDPVLLRFFHRVGAQVNGLEILVARHALVDEI